MCVCQSRAGVCLELASDWQQYGDVNTDASTINEGRPRNYPSTCYAHHSHLITSYVNPQQRIRLTTVIRRQLNKLILLAIGLRQMWQILSGCAHFAHAPWPHRKAIVRWCSRHMGHVCNSSISCRRRSSSNTCTSLLNWRSSTGTPPAGKHRIHSHTTTCNVHSLT